MASSDIVYVASGFQEDCLRLMEKFKNNESYTFQAFSKSWQEMKFSLVFLCRKTYAEMLEFCEESLHIAKQLLLSSDELIDQVGGLYLLYGLYYKIPIENVKIRVTMKEWQTILNFHKQIKEEEFYDASYIFVKLVTDNAFYHCLFECEYGIEKNFQSHQDSFDNPYSVLPNIVDEIENGELAKIQKLSKMYDVHKAKLLNNTTSKNKLQLFDKDFIDDIVNEIEALEDKRQTLTGVRKRPKEISIFNKTEKARFNYDDKIRPKLGHAFDTDSSDDENMDLQFAFVKTDKLNLPDNFDDNEDDDDNENSENDHSKMEDSSDKSNDDEMS